MKYLYNVINQSINNYKKIVNNVLPISVFWINYYHAPPGANKTISNS